MTSNPPRMLTRSAIQALGIEYSNVHLLRLEKAGQFPTRVRLGPGKVAWPESEISAWLRGKISCRRSSIADLATSNTSDGAAA